MFTDAQKQRLLQWSNVYGWSVEECERAAQEDAALQRLLEVEMQAEGMPDAAHEIRKRITQIEVCHRQCVENVRRILRMVGSMDPGPVAGCGDVDARLVAELRDTVAAAAAWADGSTAEAGTLGDDLGVRTAAKQWLVACLCKTLAQQLEHVQGDEPLAQPNWPAA
jgi:hypothetical protein